MQWYVICSTFIPRVSARCRWRVVGIWQAPHPSYPEEVTLPTEVFSSIGACGTYGHRNVASTPSPGEVTLSMIPLRRSSIWASDSWSIGPALHLILSAFLAFLAMPNV